MLSNDAFNLLKWLKKHDEWMTREKIEKDCKCFSDRSFRAIIDAKMVRNRLTMDENSWTEYRISDSGKAYLEDIRAQRLPELREWVNFLLPVLTFLGGLLLSDPVKSFFRWLFDLLS